MRFLHLSDFHFSEDRIEDFKLSLKPLISDIKEFHEKTNIDFLMISGDLVDKGGQNFKNRDTCFVLFKDVVIRPIQEAIGLDISQIYMVPGNHDVFRDADDPYQEIGLKQVLNSAEEVNKFIDSKEGEAVKRILPFKIFEQDYYQEHKHKRLTNYQSAFISERNGISVGIMSWVRQ